MTTWDSWRDPILINTVGHWAGVLLFSVTILLLLRNWKLHGITSVKLPLVAAGLALGWNLGSLLVLARPNASHAWIAAVVTASFSMLTMLPAVLLQVVCQGGRPVTTAIGYVVSLAATSLHIAELFWSNNVLHQAALLFVVVGFGGLCITAFALNLRRSPKPDTSQLVSLVCLFLFTSSFLHFGYQHTRSPWAAEITWHHLGVPLALIVLLKDYRFLLLDTFSRFLVNFGLAVVYVGTLLALGVQLRLWDLIQSSLFAAGGILVGLCLSLILFAHTRNAVQAWMSRVLFRRQSFAVCKRNLEAAGISAQSEDALLSQSAKYVADYFRTDQFAISTPFTEPLSSDTLLVEQLVQAHDTNQPFRPEATIPLRFSAGNNRRLFFGRRRGGQRYWSDDLLDMGQLGTALVEQIERFRAEELKRLVSQAELKALQAQINPHFLFNALNTLYGSIDRTSTEARKLVLNLSDIFRYFLQGDRAYISLSDELRIVEAYLQIEGLRLGSRLSSVISVSERSRSATIPILAIQPLVENAVKHGVAPKAGPCRVSVKAEDVAQGFRITVQDTGVGFANTLNRSHAGMGIGLENVRRRLILSYGPSTELNIQTSDAGTTVSFVVPFGAEHHHLAADRTSVPA